MRMTGPGRTTILGLADAGELPRLRAGRAVQFAVVDVEHLAEKMRAGEHLITGAKRG
jgi:hypothetical protein